MHKVIKQHDQCMLYQKDGFYFITNGEKHKEIEEDYAFELMELAPEHSNWLETFIESELR